MRKDVFCFAVVTLKSSNMLFEKWATDCKILLTRLSPTLILASSSTCLTQICRWIRLQRNCVSLMVNAKDEGELIQLSCQGFSSDSITHCSGWNYFSTSQIFVFEMKRSKRFSLVLVVSRQMKCCGENNWISLDISVVIGSCQNTTRSRNSTSVSNDVG